MKNGFAKKTKIGDVIALEMVSDDNDSKHLKNHYIFMKILFDVDKQYRNNPNAKKQFNVETSDETYFTWFRQTYLFEVYEGIYDSPVLPQTRKVIVPRIFIGHSQFKRHNWHIVANEAIDIEKTTFPECFSIFMNNNYEERQKGLSHNAILQMGEISFSKKISESEKLILNEYETGCVYQWLLTFITDLCWIQNRRDLLTESQINNRNESPNIERGFRKHDLMYSQEIRIKIFDYFNINPNLSYYELAKNQGFDLKNLFE